LCVGQVNAFGWSRQAVLVIRQAFCTPASDTNQGIKVLSDRFLPNFVALTRGHCVTSTVAFFSKTHGAT